MQSVEMAQIQWENGGSLDAEIFLGADLLYDPGYCLPITLVCSI